MGVRGLTTYVNSNQDSFLRQFFLYDSNLIIDGNSLCAQLYRSINCFSAFGGDYDKFASYVRKFFKSICKCNITPYVIFDGSYEARKLKTAHSRLRSKIYGASRLDPVTQGCLQIFPLLLRDVFKEILMEMDIPYTLCEFEADDEIAAMARHLNCPVLSYDSDFFIYNVIYIPYNTLEHKPVLIEDNSITKYAIECKVYKVEFLTDNFGGLNEELLPLLATLLGNDYVEKRVFQKFFSQLKLPKSRKCKSEQQRSIHGVIKWLQNETLDSAIMKILGRVKKDKKNKVFNIIKHSVDGYKNTDCRSLKYFNLSNEDIQIESILHIPDNVNNISDDESSVSSSDPSDDKSCEEFDDLVTERDPDFIPGIPNWFADGVRNHTIPPAYFNLYTHHMHFCSPQSEDYQDEDSFLCTLPMLRFAFDILTDFSLENCVYVSRESTNLYKRLILDKEYSVPRPLEVSYPDLSVDQLQFCFFQFLKFKLPKLNLDNIRLLPPNFQLYMIAVVWWVAHCDVPLANIHSLFICYIMLEVIDEKTGTLRGHKYFSNKYSKKLEEIKKNGTLLNIDDDDNELYLNKNKVQYEDCLLTADVLLKHFEIDDKIRKKPKSFDVKRMHSFAQFQCCLLQMNSLNSLCRSPFENTKYHKCFTGTFAYNIALKLENQIDPVTFIQQYLSGAHTVLKFYKSLCFVYQKLSEEMGLCTKCTTKKVRRKKKKKCEENHTNSFLVQGFESNVTL